MNPATAAKLLAINRDFYDRLGESFSTTRQRLQPGVMKIMKTLRGSESVLDLGCGNGKFLLTLSISGHRGPLLGVDYSLSLLGEAQGRSHNTSMEFREMDLTRLSDHLEEFVSPVSPAGGWDVITLFAVLHHIPSSGLRRSMLQAIRRLIKEDGRVILSNWQFLHSARLLSRIQPWERAGLSDSEVDEGDYLLDWRSGGKGLRYVHHFSAEELSGLAAGAGMRVSESFLSDGENGRLGLYQVWVPA
ncbi:MAG: class I SAM-dependent methyltransferase [Chloroflexi bacterium]|nr:class I SAM-dependent methyltransferase [Chloroflexota bacterium]